MQKSAKKIRVNATWHLKAGLKVAEFLADALKVKVMSYLDGFLPS